MTAQYRLLTLSDLMMPFRRSQSRRWGGAHRLFYPRGQIDDAARRCPRGSTAAGYGAGAELRDMTQMAQLSTL